MSDDLKNYSAPIFSAELDGHEHHPAADLALEWIRNVSVMDLTLWQETFTEGANQGDRLAEACANTLDRMLSGEPVSDRDLLGLAWVMSDCSERQSIVELSRTGESSRKRWRTWLSGRRGRQG